MPEFDAVGEDEESECEVDAGEEDVGGGENGSTIDPVGERSNEGSEE